MAGQTLKEKPAHRDFKIPPLTPQTVSKNLFNPRGMRFHFLADMVGMMGWTEGAELGCLSGRTLQHLLRTCPRLNMLGVDLWDAQPDNAGPEGWEHYNHDLHLRQCLALANQYSPRLRIVKDWTHEAVKDVADASLDFVFIDADHSYEGCKRDIIDWTPKLKPDGYLFGHDINWPGVRQACDELVPGYEIGPNVVWFRPANPAPDWAAKWKRI